MKKNVLIPNILIKCFYFNIRKTQYFKNNIYKDLWGEYSALSIHKFCNSDLNKVTTQRDIKSRVLSETRLFPPDFLKR